jgi:hypothetical protein
MKIKIIAVELSKATDKSGKPYTVVEVSYKNLSYKGAIESRKIMPFGATADTNKLLAKASAGEFYDINVVKNDKGYNDWVAAVLSDEDTPAAAPATSGKAAPASAAVSATTSVPKSTYETAEERAKKQVYIVRQSSITSAMAFLQMTGEQGTARVADVLDLAKKFENYVFGIETPAKAPYVDLADMEDDIPE